MQTIGTSHISVEFRLLVLLLRLELGYSPKGSILAFVEKQPIDWKRLERLAIRHRVVSSISAGLQSLDVESLFPKDIRDAFGRRSQSLALRQMSLVSELLKVSRSFESSGLRYLCLKGSTLSQRLYNDPARRHSSDLDILVSPEDYAFARQCLGELGFIPEQEAGCSRPPAISKPNTFYHSHLRKNGFLLELHWRLSRNDFLYPVNFGDIFRRKQTVFVGGQLLPMLGDRDCINYLTLHGTSHCWNRLKWIFEMEVYRKSVQPLESDPTIDCAEAHLRRAIAWRDGLLRSLFGPDEEQILSNNETGPARLVVSLSLAQLTSEQESPANGGHVLRRSLALFYAATGVRSKARFLHCLLVWPEVFKIVHLPQQLRFLYIILGPMAWLLVQVCGLFRNARRRMRAEVS